jgi:hypothetical protein
MRPSFYVRGGLPPDLEPQKHTRARPETAKPPRTRGGFAL